MNQNINKLVIVGSGPAALTAGIYAARANLYPIAIQGDNPGGQLVTTSLVENWPGETKILGPTLMKKMRTHAKELGVVFMEDSVISSDFTHRPFTLTTKKGTIVRSHAIIIATGSSPHKLGCPGEDTYWGKGITTCAICDGALYKDQPLLVIGGGDSGMEAASFLTKFTNNITVVQNLEKLTASHAMQKRVINDPRIKIMYNSTVSSFEGDGKRVSQAIIINLKNNSSTRLSVDGVFITIGLMPNTAPFVNQVKLNQYGYIQLEYNSQTSVPGIFAAGDVHDPRYRQAITAAGDGCKAALDSERYLSNNIR